MKTKTIFQKTAVIFAMFVFIVFAISACSSDDDFDNPIPIPTPLTSFNLPAGDYPSVISDGQFQAVEMGIPILTETEKHIGNFSPDITSMQAENWRSKIRRKTGNSLTGYNYEYEEHNFGDTPYWCEAIPKADYHFWDATINRHLYNYNVSMPGKFKKRFALMEDGNWKTTDFLTSENRDVGWSHDIIVELRFKQIIPESDLYISMERDYIKLPGNEFNRTEGYHELTINKKVGAEQTQITTMGGSLSLNVSGGYGPFEASLSATIYGENTNQITFVTYDESTYKHNITVPPGESWKYIKLSKIERYFFSDSNGNRWKSDNFEYNGFGEVTNYIGEEEILIKYNSDGEIISQ